MRSRIYTRVSALTGALILLSAACRQKPSERINTPSVISPNSVASVDASWPWQGVVESHPWQGVASWEAKSVSGTDLQLTEFDFNANPRLRLELYDQDEDDAKPGDDSVEYWPGGVGQVTRHLRETRGKKIIEVWNGLFFTSEAQGGRKLAHHLAPVVLKGKPLYNVGNHRWTFGVKYQNGKPVFKTLHMPDENTLANGFDYASAGAQCLILKGRPLKLHPFPHIGDKLERGPFPSTPDQAGHIMDVDHMKTSRTSLAWSEDSRKFYVLIIKEPDTEVESALWLHHGKVDTGGWTVADLQHFWLTMKVFGAVNLDGGDVTQATTIRSDGKYDLIPPRWADGSMRRVWDGDFSGAPAGGTLMYFYVRDTK